MKIGSSCLILTIVLALVAVGAWAQDGRGAGAGQGQGQVQGQVQGQGQGRGQGRGQGGPPAAPLPQTPTAVSLPKISGPITGPGPIYESVQSLAPGKDLNTFKYEAKEYFISGTANGQPYKTRVVVRKPANNSKFSGLVMVEPMHPSGSAHMFEYTSIYTMTSGHAAVEILAGGMQLVTDANAERYKDLKVAGAQTNEIIAQVGSLIKSKDSGNP